MRVIVQKFGGTSVANKESRAAVIGKVKGALDKGYQSIVVISAMGRNGDTYATDTLINLAKAENDHVNKRELDAIMSCGELISCAVMSAAMQKEGLKAIVLTGGQAGIVTDNNFGSARIMRVDTENLMQLLGEGYTPVVCGFQGITEDNIYSITTIGRGGSDTTAAALGAAINAELVEIYTDVEGIMTADPRMVDNAQILRCISYGEICQLAHQGAKVIHPRAVEIAMQKNIQLIVRSTFSEAPGTLITNNTREETSDIVFDECIASGVTYLKDIAQLRVTTKPETHMAVSMQIFNTLAEHCINVDCLNVHPGEVLFTVNMDELDRAIELLTNADLDVSYIKDCSKVSVVGGGMKDVPGVMATFVNAIAGRDIEILQTVDSNNTIAAVVEQRNLNITVVALHEAFNLSKQCC